MSVGKKEKINVLSLFDGFLFGIDCGFYYICAWKNQ